jgi:protein TonB
MPSAYGALHLAGDDPHEIDVLLLGPVTNGTVVGAGSPLRKANRPPSDPAARPKVKPAQLIKRVSPVYPDAAKKAGIRGTVRIATIIHADGTLDDLVVLSAPSPDLALAGLLAVRQWRYSPTYLDDRPVEASLTIDVNFER